jgi:hypothetical protein
MMDRNVRINKAIYMLSGGGGELTKRGLEANRLFKSETQLKEFVHNCFTLYNVGNQNQTNITIQKAFESEYLQIEKKGFYHLKINKVNKIRFFDSLPLDFKDLALANEENILGSETRSQKSKADNGLENADNIIETVSTELELFQKSFFDLLTKLIKRFENAKMYDNVVDTSQIRNGKQPLRLKAAENLLSQLLYIFHTVEKAYILRFMKLATGKIVDEHVLSKVCLLVITKLADMRRAVYQALSSFHGGRFNSYFYDNIYTEEMLQKHAKTFQDTGIKDAEPLLESIAQIYKSVD